jgi:Mycobacterium membrane protein
MSHSNLPPPGGDYGPPAGGQPYPGGQQPWPPQQPPPLPKRRKWPWIVGGIVLLLIIVSVANGRGDSSITTTPAASSTAPPPAVSEAADSAQAGTGSGSVVVYEVIGKGTAKNITYMKEGFSQEQQTSAKLPWKKELQFKEKIGPISSPLSLIAQNGASSGDITCRISVDGKVVGESTSNGQYAVVTCNGNAS